MNTERKRPGGKVPEGGDAAGRLPVYTIGHSTRSLEEFVDLLREFGVELVADVRTVPHSRHNPQFDTAMLSRALPEAGMAYVHLAGLGGFRHARPDSVNKGWRNESFRAFADYMRTPEFAGAIDDLIDRARAARTALMCAEAVPWRCHRSLIADALVVRGLTVIDILGPGSSRPHGLTPFARVDGTAVSYPAPQDTPAAG